MKDRVDLERVWKLQMAGTASDCLQHLEWSNPLVVKLFAWAACSDVLGIQPNKISSLIFYLFI